MALSSVELGTRNVSVIVSFVTPWPVAPPLSPLNAGVQLGEWPVHVNWRTFGPHLAPVLAIPAAAAVAPGAAPAAGVVPFVAPVAPVVVLVPAAVPLVPPLGVEAEPGPLSVAAALACVP